MLINLLVITTLIFFCLMIYLLFAPLLLEIDSRYNLYRFRIVPVFSVCWITDNLSGHAEICLFGIRKKLSFNGFEKKTMEKETKTQKSTAFRPSFHRFFSIIKSFKVENFYANIDTGNMALNGELFPMMYPLSAITGKTFQINFLGKTEIALTLKNNAFRILKAYFKQ
ncbi:MAG: hypothetical protein HYU69_07445 [Bacteroidetes bacterium]|nr:hypothetical protein [Bacteroidota bacterium]